MFNLLLNPLFHPAEELRQGAPYGVAKYEDSLPEHERKKAAALRRLRDTLSGGRFWL